MPQNAIEPYIYERITDDGRLTGYQVKIRRVGFPNFVKTFDSLSDARTAVVRALADQSRGIKANPLLAERTTLGDVIREAKRDLEDGRREVKGKVAELSRLRVFLKREKALCAYSMANLTSAHMEAWKQDRLKQVAPNTVLRELRLLRTILKNAATKLHLPKSPLDDVENPSVQDERVARFKPGEEARLFAELEKCRNPLVLMAARFSLETACRQSELLRLRFEDYDANLGAIYLHDSKNGRGRHILLTECAQDIVERLRTAGDGTRIFPITAEAIKQAFERARTRAGMAHWRWHDFRHEAISRAFDAGLSGPQIMDFSGHVDMKSLERY